MKRILIIISTFCLIMISAQKVSDYKYVSIPEKFQTFKSDYGLEDALSKFLKGKKYIVLPSDKQQWPSEAKQEPCNIIDADVLNDSSLLRNKVVLQFKDCNNKVMFVSKGSSNIKEFVEGYKDALQQSIINVPVSNPQTGNKADLIANTVSDLSETGASQYSNGKLTLQKIQIDENQFILVNPNISVPYATFKTTTKKDVFRVKLQNGDSTIGYYESDNIVVETPQSNGEYSKEVFLAK